MRTAKKNLLTDTRSGCDSRHSIRVLLPQTASVLACLAVCSIPGTLFAAEPAVQLKGADFTGGANSHFGAEYYGKQNVNYVYATPTGAASSMTASFNLDKPPAERLFLFLEAMDDDSASACHVRLTLNDRAILEGPSGFPNGQWGERRFEVPADLLKAGANNLSIANIEPQGTLGQPPWFMVARVALGDSTFKMPVIKLPSLEVQLPTKERPFPEPLSDGHSRPGFKFRGTKGWAWTPEQYIEEIPYLAKFKMNFLMNCYLSMFTSKLGEPFKNEWWKPMSEARKAAYSEVFKTCREYGITFCFAVHPQLGSPRPLNPASQADIDQLYAHYAWAQSQGVHWFSVSLDDVSWSVGGPAACGASHARLVNTIFNRLRAKDSEAQLIFCPGPYWGDGSNPEHHAYLETLGKELHPDVYVFWTGDAVVTPRITVKAAESYKRVVKHRLFLWDNYPVNDANPTLHLGPVSGRERGLCDVIDGYMSNPMAAQNEINRIPLATCADYAYNPWDYDPSRSIGQAILHLAKTEQQRATLRELVEAYPGFIVTGGGTGKNDVRARFEACLASDDSHERAQEFRRKIQALDLRFAKEFPTSYRAARKTMEGDLAWMTQRLKRGQ